MRNIFTIRRGKMQRRDSVTNVVALILADATACEVVVVTQIPVIDYCELQKYVQSVLSTSRYVRRHCAVGADGCVR